VVQDRLDGGTVKDVDRPILCLADLRQVHGIRNSSPSS
jgi:hypothetical protein